MRKEFIRVYKYSSGCLGSDKLRVTRGAEGFRGRQ